VARRPPSLSSSVFSFSFFLVLVVGMHVVGFFIYLVLVVGLHVLRARDAAAAVAVAVAGDATHRTRVATWGPLGVTWVAAGDT
jgi:hypothetical protein